MDLSATETPPLTGPPVDPETVYREDQWLVGNAGEDFNRMMESRLRADTAAGLHRDDGDPFR